MSIFLFILIVSLQKFLSESNFQIIESNDSFRDKFPSNLKSQSIRQHFTHVVVFHRYDFLFVCQLKTNWHWETTEMYLAW